MSYDPKTDKMDWRDEATWIAISCASGLLLAVAFLRSGRFTAASPFVLVSICMAGFYVLSILIRIQNQRGRIHTGKALVDERYLKFIFPIAGFGLGVAILLT
jgi:hypothetical protein